MKRALVAAGTCFGLATAAHAYADDPPTDPSQIVLTNDTKPTPTAPEEATAPAPEAPPPPPYKSTLVLEGSGGVLAFVGKFKSVAPPAPWMHLQLGYEVFRWLMVFGEGELAFSDTSHEQKPPSTRAFPLFGFGGGARFTVRFSDRVGAYAQGSLGAMKAEIAENALGILGFHDAESLGLYLSGRLGVEWYQVDRHFALGLSAGARLAKGFAKTSAASDTPGAVDAAVAVRYAF